MAIKTSPFTGWKLSGKDVEIFLKQVDDSRPNVRAQEALVKGRALCSQIGKNGYSPIKPTKTTLR